MKQRLVMNDQSVKDETQQLPTVFMMDLQKREEFLSQIGSFTQEQRRIFHRICDFYDPALDFNRFILHAGKDILFANNQIEILMKKVRTAHYGLLKFRHIDGELKPDKIIISNRDSHEYFLNLIEDEIQRNLLNDGFEFLKMEDLEEQNQRVPFDFLETMQPKTLSPRYLEHHRNGSAMFTIPLKTGGAILTTSSSLKYLIIQSKNMIKSYLLNTSFISIVSRYMDIKISEIQKMINTDNQTFWLSISSKILKNREDLQVKLKHIESPLYQACELLHYHYKNALKEEEEIREENKARETALEEVCMEILKKEDFLVTGDELIKLLESHEKRWPGFKDYFYDVAVKVNNNIGLPIILGIDNKFIHRDHVYPYFRSELTIQSKELKFYYIQLMERMLRTGNKDKITIFYTRDTFKEDVRESIKRESPVLADFLNRPRVISEGIVHYFKNLKKVRDVNKIKEFMNNFFNKGVIKFKDPDYLLNLYLLEIFDEAYKFLSWWKKLVLKVSGKKDSFKSQFSGLEGGNPGNVPPVILMDKKKKRRESVNVAGNYRKSDSSSKKGKSRKSDPLVAQKMYSIKQREKAWTEFEDAFNKKKKN